MYHIQCTRRGQICLDNLNSITRTKRLVIFHPNETIEKCIRLTRLGKGFIIVITNRVSNHRSRDPGRFQRKFKSRKLK